VWIEFKNATKNQLFDLFVRFYSPYHSSQRGATASEEDDFIEVTEEDCSIDKKQSKTDGPDTDLISLARRFAAIIPEDSVAVAALQGYLLRHKRRPQEAVRDAEKWVEDGFPQGPVSASLLHQ
jgi:chaperone BCS1